MYLLDTNACIRFLNRTSQPLVARFQQTHPSQLFLSSVVKAELTYGAYRSARSAENLRVLKKFFEPLVSLPFDDRCLDHYGRARADMSRIGTPIGPNDLLIASTALAHSLTLVTHNSHEFGRVSGLEIVDWEQS